MKAIRVHKYGDASQLRYEEIAKPTPKAGELCVQVEATGLNFIEIYLRAGLYKGKLPFTPGDEFAGTVDALGEGVTGFRIGDRVATASGDEGYAQYAIAPAEKTIKVRDGISAEQAAAVMLQGITAHFLTKSTYPLKPGETVLIHAAAGGVGQLLIQMAKMSEARVLATTSNEEKSKIAKEAGADEVILYSKVDFVEEVKRLTDGKGVHVVYDGVGKKTFLKGLDCLRPRGMMVTFGNASGAPEAIEPRILVRKGSLFLTRPGVGDYLQNREEFLWRANDLFDWIQAGRLNVRVDKTFPLEKAADAQRYMEAGSTKGKVLLIP
jgi:NADPH2:quinone reductase